jgi:hypothetical protein
MINSCGLYELAKHGNRLPEVVRNVQRLGVKRIEVKAADGPYAFTTPRWSAWGGKQNLTADLVTMLHEIGVQVYGWGFNYGILPELEGDIAAVQTVTLNLDGWLFDVEGKFFSWADAEKRVERMMRTFRGLVPSRLAGFNSFPLWHNPDIPANIYWKRGVYATADPYINFWQPMAYWQGSNSEVVRAFVRNSILQHREISDKPVIVECRGWSDNKGKITPDLVDVCWDTCRANLAAGASWWRSDLVLADPLVLASIERLC